MSLTPAEIGYLATQRLGRLATAQPDGTLQVSPAGFRYNADLGVPIIRIHPRRLISFGLTQPDVEPHLLIPTKRNVG